MAARLLVGRAERRRPKQANLCRAISTAYYAMFHALARTCADLMVGGANADRSKHAWRQVYRSLDHGPAKEACKSKKLAQFPDEIADFALNFKTLQELRHLADYDPTFRVTRSEVETHIDNAEESIRKLQSCTKKDRRAFAALALFRPPRT